MNIKRFHPVRRPIAGVIRLLLGASLLMVPRVAAAPATGTLALDPPPIRPEVWLTETNNNQRVELVEGQILGVRLEAKPSAGYLWEVVTLDERLLQPVGQTEFEQASPLPGAPATQIFRFKVVDHGESGLSLAYRRPWQRLQSLGSAFAVQVVAQPASGPISLQAEKGLITPGQTFMHLERPAQASGVESEPGEIKADGPVGLPKDMAGWTTLMTEGFEGSFPGASWTLYWNGNSSQDGWGYTWDDSPYKARTGNWSGWCAEGQCESNPDIDAPGPYLNDTDAWMVYGPFDLTDAQDAELLFYRWQRTETFYDFLFVGASLNGLNFYGSAWSGYSGGWTLENFDLTNVHRLDNLCGYRNVWIAFVFTSDYSITDEGAYLDDIVLRKDVWTPPSLPAAFDWRPGGVTPVKDQGSCGSCWAFSTVGPAEASIRIWDGLATDLSEQYLVSCNTDGWDCDGGWFAHDYHQWKTPSSESEAGAVLESASPYTASDAPCSGPYSHPYTIASWSCVDPTAIKPRCVTWTLDQKIPLVWSIKRAIHDHGPVSAAVFAGSSFAQYSGGVFETPEYSSVLDYINHAIVLVGWDDGQGTNGVWILKNSWGTYWGESGYMRIGYAVSKVGACANYVEYSSCQPPSAPILLSPDNGGHTCDTTPSFDWSSVTGATSYQIQVDDNSSFSSPEIDATSSTSSYTPSSSLSLGTYFWRARASNSCGNGPWSAVWSFTIDPPPTAPILLWPANASHTCDTTPSLDWSTVSGATLYRFQMDSSSSFSSPEIDATTSTSSYTPSAPVSPGTYYWRVRATSCGDGPWSAVWTFTIDPPPPAPTLLSPANSSHTCDTTPDLCWSSVSSATSYDIQVDNSSSFPSPEIDTTTSAICYTSSLPLSPDTHYWHVRASNDCGNGSWSPMWSFTIHELPGLPSNPSPTDGATGISLNADLDWSDASGATSYDVYLGTSPTPPYVGNTTSSSYNLSPLNASTHYHWRIVAKSSCGNTPGPIWDFATGAANHPPTNGTVSPSSGSAPAGQIQYFTTTWFDPDGQQDLKACTFHIGPNKSMANNAMLLYNAQTNRIRIRNNNGTKWWGDKLVGSATVVQNKQAKVYCALTTVARSGNMLQVTWAIEFKPAFKGSKNLYLRVKDLTGAKTRLQQKGTWSIE